jgi:acetyl-CoA carboxylase carboxyl transferase subunit alpha
MKMTAADLAQLGVVDRVVAEPVGGAHRHPGEAVRALGAAIGEELDALGAMTPEQVRGDRRAKYLRIG